MKSLPLSKIIEGFLIVIEGRGLSPNTISDYKNTYRKFIAHVGNVQISDIQSIQVSAFLAAQIKAHSKKTALNCHIGLSSMWKWAVSEGYVKENIMATVERPKPKKVAIQPFNEVEIRAMLQSVKQDPERNRAMILLMLDTCVRASELCELKRTDIDLVRRQIKVTGKGDKERLLPFSARTASALFTYLARNEEEEKPFPIKRCGLSQYLRRLGKRAGVKNVHPHRFRHTGAIALLRGGMNIYSLQQMLGHSSLDMVKHYLAIVQVDIDEAHRRASPVESWKL